MVCSPHSAPLRGGFRPSAPAPPLPSARRPCGAPPGVRRSGSPPALWLRLSGRGSPAARAAPAPRRPRCGPCCGPARLGPASLGLWPGSFRPLCVRPLGRCGLSYARPRASAGLRSAPGLALRVPRPPGSAPPGPPLRRPAGAALRLPSRLPPGGLWRGGAPLFSAPGPPASGVGVRRLRAAYHLALLASRVKTSGFAALDARKPRRETGATGEGGGVAAFADTRKENDNMNECGECRLCSWWEDGICRNPDSDYLEQTDEYDGCTLCDMAGSN